MPSAPLQKAGDDFAAAMVRDDFYDHQGPDGSNETSRALGAGYAHPDGNYWIGENLAVAEGTTAAPAVLVKGWMDSPVHREVILDERFREFGLGMAAGVPPSQSAGAGTTYAAEFGVKGTEPA